MQKGGPTECIKVTDLIDADECKGKLFGTYIDTIYSC